MKKSNFYLFTLLWIVQGAPFFILARYNYQLYHLIVEVAITIIGVMIFSISTHAKNFNKKSLFVLLGPGLFVSSIIGFLHALTYHGMNLIPGYDANLPTQLWIVLSYIQAFAFLFPVLYKGRRSNYYIVSFMYIIVGILFTTLTFIRIFPDCYIPGIGLTPFKKLSELVIILMYVLTIVLLNRAKSLNLLFRKKASFFIFLLILSELLFTLYFDVHDLFNFFGHYIKFGAFLFICETMISELILVPYKKIVYDSLHSEQTGLYNHKYLFDIMDETVFNNPSIIVLDINSLKLINEAFGYSKGDQLISKMGEIIKFSLPEDVVAAHIGGGEFALVIDNSDDTILHLTIETIEEKIENYNNENPDLPLSITCGFAFSYNGSKKIQFIYQEALESMYAKKTLNIKSTRNTLVKTLMKALETRDHTTLDHANRTTELAVELAKKIGITDNWISLIVLLTKFHDIGKIGIPDNILLKPGRLNDEERLLIQKHSKLGYEIAISCSELAHISDFILKHHERWDGKGYPLGISGEDIPIECRILAIVDAYDAMINDRPYRKAMSKEDALEEIKRCAGTQFDPVLVESFLEVIKTIDESLYSKTVLPIGEVK